jgi:hypothetical protein
MKPRSARRSADDVLTMPAMESPTAAAIMCELVPDALV